MESINDYPTGTVFGSITVSGGTYQFQNNPIQSTTVAVQGDAVLTAVSIVCDTLTIGTPPGAASNAVATNTKAPLTANVSQPVASRLSASTAADNTAINSSTIDATTVVEQPMASKVSPATALATPADVILSAPEAPPIAFSISPVVGPTISTAEMASATRLLKQLDQQQWTTDSDAFLATSFNNQSAHSFSGLFPMTDRLEDSVYDELTDSLTKAKKQSSTALTESQSAHSFALQSIVSEFQQDIAVEQEDSELLVIKHFRKQDKLTQKAIDEIHSYLVACDR